jgi:apolipoprotein N-acyltransferase
MSEAGEAPAARSSAAKTAVRAAIALGAGAVHALAFAPANLPWLELLALAAVFWLALHAAPARAALGIGFAFGLGWLGVGLSWTYISLHEYGELAAPLAALASAALAALLAAFPALALAAAATCGPPAGTRRAVAIVAAWTLAEWLRGVVLTGLPWLATGYAHTDGPLAGYAPVLGVYGVGAAAALTAMLPLWARARMQPATGPAAPRARIAPTAIAALLLVAVLGTGAALRTRTWTQDHGAPIRVRLVQGNIAQDIKFAEGGLDQAVARYLPAMDFVAPGAVPAHPPGAPDLIVLPESAFPVPVNDLPDDVLQVISDARRRAGAALIFGAFIREPPARYFNSAIGLGTESIEPQRYSKRHLVPFGEFIPLGFHWFVDLLQIPIGDQERGDQFQPPMALAGQQVAVNICFEDLFGAQILSAWHDPQREPTILLNLSNLAWFDDSIALPQHLQISRMRALETAHPLLRATNTGITAIIDERGRVQAQLPVQTRAVLDGVVQGKSGVTPFIRAGNTPILVAALLAVLACRFWMRRDAAANAGNR